MILYTQYDTIQKKKGGDYMNWIIRLAQHKTMLTIAVALVFGALLAPASQVLAGHCTGTDVHNAAGNCVAAAVGAVDKTDQTFGVGDEDVTSKELQLGNKDLDEAVIGIINVLLGFLGLIAVVIILIGGFKWMTAGGGEEKVEEAKKMIFSGIIGLAIILSAWAIAQFVIKQLAIATESGDFTSFEE